VRFAGLTYKTPCNPLLSLGSSENIATAEGKLLTPMAGGFALLSLPIWFGTTVALCTVTARGVIRIMRSAFYITGAGALAIGLAILATPTRTKAQETPSDRFEITLSQPVTVGNKVLTPGEYSVKPLTLAGGDAPVLMISGPRGIHLQTAALITATVENRIQPETRVTLHHIGSRYYLDNIWVKGMDYGYHFPLPKGVKKPAGEVQ
jgi:hypothetical protein